MGEIIKKNNASINTTSVFIGLLLIGGFEVCCPEYADVTKYCKEMLYAIGMWLAKDANK